MTRRLRRAGLAVACLGSLFALLASSIARAGTDVFQNIAPASPLGGSGAIGRWTLSHYELDHHFTVISASITGGVDVSGLLPIIAWFFASAIWLATSFLARVVIELFAFAFSLDLINGSSATGGAGALAPVSQAIHSIYANVFGAPWLVLAISVVGMWAMWRALVQRRYSETAGALAMSLVYVVIALFFVAEPGQTIGQASRWTNEMSRAFLSVSDHGDPSGGQQATDDDAEALWSLLALKPWTVLEFGGLEHCAVSGTGDEDSDPDSAPVRPLSQSPSRDAELAHRLQGGDEVTADGKVCVNNLNKYASHFLRFGADTDERDEEYEALNHGDAEKLPEADDERAGYRLGVADKPATDAMEEGGQYQRLLMAPVIFVGDLGAVLLLGSLAIGVILSQVLLLLLLAFSPVALVAAAIPGRGHDFFKAWLEKLGGYLLRKAAYSLVLAVLLAVNGAIADATSSLGWLFAFGLQALFFWTVLVQRRTLTDGIVGIATGPRVPGHGLAVDALALYTGARLGVRGPLRGIGRAGASLSRNRGSRGGGARRRSAIGAGNSVPAGAEHPATGAPGVAVAGVPTVAPHRERTAEDSGGARTERQAEGRPAETQGPAVPDDRQPRRRQMPGDAASVPPERSAGEDRTSTASAEEDGDHERPAGPSGRESGPDREAPSSKRDRDRPTRQRVPRGETPEPGSGTTARGRAATSTRSGTRPPGERTDPPFPGSNPGGSRLSDELRAERQRASSAAGERKETPPSSEGGPDATRPDPEPSPAAGEPASPPRRRRPRLRRPQLRLRRSRK